MVRHLPVGGLQPSSLLLGPFTQGLGFLFSSSLFLFGICGINLSMDETTSQRYWNAILQMLIQDSCDLSIKCPCPYGIEVADSGFEKYLQHIFDKEKEFREEALAATRHYMNDSEGEWPEQSPWSGYFNVLRLQCASEFICQITAHDHSGLVIPFPSGKKSELTLAWLLIDHWERCFDVYLKLTALSFYFRIPLYGMYADDN